MCQIYHDLRFTNTFLYLSSIMGGLFSHYKYTYIFFLTIKIKFDCMRLVMPAGRLWLTDLVRDNTKYFDDGSLKE